jgi:invasion protein IalB
VAAAKPVVPIDRKERRMELGKFARLAALAAGLGAVASPAYAQDKPAAAPAAPADVPGPGPMTATPPAPPQPNWVKICNTDPAAKKEVCLVSRDLRAETGQTVASVAVRTIAGEPKKFILAAVPPGLLIQPGVRVAVDQNAPANGKYSICFPNACYAELEINDAFFKNMQKGSNLIIQAMNQQAKTLNFPVALGGFSKAFEGPAADPKAIEEYKKEMNEGMNRLAQERRDKLQAPGSAVPPSDGGPQVGDRAPVKAQ